MIPNWSKNISLAVLASIGVVLFIEVFGSLYESEEIDVGIANSKALDVISDPRRKFITDHYHLVKERFFLNSGMVESELGKTTSETQSYAMLMALYSDDQKTFDLVWKWTKDNLQNREADKLFSWLWKEGRVTDVNPATDADQDIAYALYSAHQKWGGAHYLQSATDIVRDIWNVETRELSGVRYVTAGNWATKFQNSVIINPSYLAPYQYRVFAVIDPEHDWNSMVDSSYAVLNKCSSSAGLARNWCQIDHDGNVIEEYSIVKGSGKNYSFDALRVPYRIAMDYYLNKDQRGFDYLIKNKIFIEDWKKYGKIFTQYNQRGGYIGTQDSLASYGAQLAQFSLLEKSIADEIFEKKILAVLSWENVSFYDMSWVWFGAHFYEKQRNSKS